MDSVTTIHVAEIENEPGSGKLFGPLSKFHIILAFVALMMLRVVIGFHFFKEGTDKLTSGTFTAEHFLKGARGPFAPLFHSMVDDDDGRQRLCLTENKEQQGFLRYELDPQLTFSLWDDFVDRAVSYYDFGSQELEQQIVDRRSKMGARIREARKAKDSSVDTRALEQQRREDEAAIIRIRDQIDLAEQILSESETELTNWLAINQEAIVEYFGTENRLQGFDRDGASRDRVAVEVASLREQVDKIRSERQGKLNGWNAEVEAIWNAFETRINNLAIADQTKNKEPLNLHRPFDQPNSKLNVINRVIPWFDTIVGALLILGLFTRLASLAGAGFLASVIASQPPWFPGVDPNYYVIIELFALLVVFATCAGRLGGLDFFFAKNSSGNSSQNENTEGRA